MWPAISDVLTIKGDRQVKNWTVIVYEKGRHTGLPNGCCRFGIPLVIPMVSEFNAKAKQEILRPALGDLAFIPADERLVRLALDTVRYVDDVWRLGSGDLVSIPDAQLQHFLDGLAKREKKPARVKKGMNLAEMAEAEWFATYAHLYGLQAAVKRFGRDVRESIEKAA